MSFSLPSLPSIPNIPGLGLPSLPVFDIPQLPQLPSIPSLDEIKGAGDLAKITSAVPGLSGLNNLCGFSLPQVDIYFAMAILKALAKGRLPGALAAKIGAAQDLLNKLDKYRVVAETLISLQQDLANLNVRDPVAVNEFLKRWGPKLPPGQARELVRQLTEALDKGLNFDICSLVPNLNITQEDVIKVLSKNSPTPKENPPDPATLPSTVADLSLSLSTNMSGVEYAEALRWQTEVEPLLVSAMSRLYTAIQEVSEKDPYRRMEKLTSLVYFRRSLVDYAEAVAFTLAKVDTQTDIDTIARMENNSRSIRLNPDWEPYLDLVPTVRQIVESNSEASIAYAEWSSAQLTPFADKVTQGL